DFHPVRVRRRRHVSPGTDLRAESRATDQEARLNADAAECVDVRRERRAQRALRGAEGYGERRRTEKQIDVGADDLRLVAERTIQRASAQPDAGTTKDEVHPLQASRGAPEGAVRRIVSFAAHHEAAD